MGNWDSRSKKLKNRNTYKSMSKPFKKKHSDLKKCERIRIREAQRAKYNIHDDDDETYHG